jgi:hypothetical protein
MSYLSSGGMCCGAGYGSYGFDPVTAGVAINSAGALLDQAGNIIGDIGDALGLGHPLDKSRIAGANQLGAQAYAGDRIALLRLKCLGGIATQAERDEYTRLTGSTDCQPFATADTRKYAADLAIKLSSTSVVLGGAVRSATMAGASLASNPIVWAFGLAGLLYFATRGGARRRAP